jgi:type VI secretion system protein ImpH
MAAHRPARPDKPNDAFPTDVRGMNFYVLMEALYRRYGGRPRSRPCAPSLRRKWRYLNPTPALPFQVAN